MFRCHMFLTCSLVTLAWLSDATQGQPPAKDLHGDPLPPGALARLGSVRWRHGGVATFAAFSPDGKTVVTVGDDRTIRVWEFPSGKEIRRIGKETLVETDASNLRAAALSPDGKTIAACFDNRVLHLRDVATGKELPRLAGDLTGVAAVAFAPNSKELATLDLNGIIHIWDWAKGQEIRQFGGAAGATNVASPHLIYSPDGKWIAQFNRRGKIGKAGKKAAGGFAGGKGASEVLIWDPSNGANLITVPGGNKVNLRAMALSPNGKMLAFSAADGTIMLVDPETGLEIRNFKAEKSSAEGLLFSLDGTKLYVRSPLEACVREWDVATGELLRKLSTGPPSSITIGTTNPSHARLALSPDGSTLVLTGYDKAPQFIDLATGKQPVVMTGHTAPLTGLQFTTDGKNMLTRDTSGQTRKWDTASGKDLGPFALPAQAAHAAISPDGKYVAAGLANESGYLITLFDAANGKALSKTLPFSGPLPNTRLLFSPDSKVLASRSANNTIELYDVPGARLLRSLEMGAAANNIGFAWPVPADSMVFSPDGKTLAVHLGSEALGLWDTVTGHRVGLLRLPNEGPIHGSLVSPDGRCLAVDMNDGTVALYELATGQLRRSFGLRQEVPWRTGQEGGPRVAFAPNGKLLAHVGHDRQVRVWEVNTGKELAVYKGHTAVLTAIAFAPDGKTLASASADTTALIWDVSKLSPVANAPGSPPQKRGDIGELWEALADQDAAKAFAAICDLAAAPKAALALIKDKVKPAAKIEAQAFQKWIAQLDDGQYDVRETANRELLKTGEPALPAITKALASNPPLEARRRLEALQAALTSRELRGDRLREHRAVEVLERIGTPEARQVLQALANGEPSAWLTGEAVAALKRLNK